MSERKRKRKSHYTPKESASKIRKRLDEEDWYQTPPAQVAHQEDERSEDELNRLQIVKGFTDVTTHLPIELYRSSLFIRKMDEQYQRDCKELDSCCRRLRQGEPMRKRIRELMKSTTSYRDETLAEIQKLQNRVESQITILTTEIDKIENPLKRPLFLEVEETDEKRNDDFDIPIEANEPLYCYCNRVSFGKMVACENEDCQGGEWFHFECIGLKTAPKGSWYCDVCSR